ncbi:MAG: Uma2 family endonuclease [Myxococcota bacterium]
MTMSVRETPLPREMPQSTSESFIVGGFSYVRAPVPVHFPEHDLVPETKRHLEQRTLLYQILKLAFADHALIGCDQFVYWDPTDPRQCLAPDAFVRLGAPDEMFGSWKVWERGAPEVAVEIISHNDSRDRHWESRLSKYRRLGVRELVRFEAEEDGVISLRIWDSVDNDLVERNGVGRIASSRCLPGSWVVTEDSTGVPMLRLSRDPEGREFYPTPEERAERAEQAEQRIRERAEQRIRELEAELSKRGG